MSKKIWFCKILEIGVIPVLELTHVSFGPILKNSMKDDIKIVQHL